MICRSKLFTGQTGCSLIGTTTLYRATATISLVVSEFTGSRYYARCRHHLIIIRHQSDSSCWSRLCDVTPDPFGTLRCSAEDTAYIHTTLHQTPHRQTHYCKTLSDSQHCATSSSTCCYTDSDTAVMCAITEL